MSLPRRGPGEIRIWKHTKIKNKQEPESIRLFRKQKLAFQTLKGISKWYQPLEMQLIHETVDGTCRTMTFFVNTPSHRQFNAVLSSEPDLDRLYPPSLFYTKMKTGTVPSSSDWWSSHPQNHNDLLTWVSTPNHTGFTPVGCLLRITSQMTIFHQWSSLPSRLPTEGVKLSQWKSQLFCDKNLQ